jgi:hypothetical protein
MSNNNWESGTLVLPTSAVPSLRKALCDAANEFHKSVLAECLRLWNGPIARTSSPQTYYERFYAGVNRDIDAHIGDAVSGAMFDIIGWQHRDGPPLRTPHEPTDADVDKFAPRADARTTSFGSDGRWDWMIKIDGNNLYYNSGEGNHQVEHARSHPVVEALMDELDGIEWTRATGGAFVGNDEYRKNSDSSIFDDFYTTRVYGPRSNA